MDVFVVLLLSGLYVPTSSFPKKYYFVNDNKIWNDASNYCIKEYTALAQVTNLDNDTALKNTPTGGYTGKAWIGLYVALLWTWLDGQLITYSKWLNGQPNDLDGLNTCVITGYLGNWQAVSCNGKQPSVCFNGNRYTLNNTLMTWDDAKANCESKNSTLAQIYDSETNTEVMAFVPVGGYAWIGLRLFPQWLWSETNQINTFMNWETGQPDNPNQEENCAAVVVENGTWTNEPCNAQYPFFCYGIYKSKKRVVSMNIQTNANLENPVNSAALMQQLQAALTDQGVIDFKLTWTQQRVKKSKKTTEDPY